MGKRRAKGRAGVITESKGVQASAAHMALTTTALTSTIIASAVAATPTATSVTSTITTSALTTLTTTTLTTAFPASAIRVEGAGVLPTRPDLSHAEARALHGVIVAAERAAGVRVVVRAEVAMAVGKAVGATEAETAEVARAAAKAEEAREAVTAEAAMVVVARVVARAVVARAEATVVAARAAGRAAAATAEVIVIATNAIGFDRDGFDHSELKDIPCEVRGARPIPLAPTGTPVCSGIWRGTHSPSARQMTEPRARALGVCVPSTSGVDAVGPKLHLPAFEPMVQSLGRASDDPPAIAQRIRGLVPHAEAAVLACTDPFASDLTRNLLLDTVTSFKYAKNRSTLTLTLTLTLSLSLSLTLALTLTLTYFRPPGRPERHALPTRPPDTHGRREAQRTEHGVRV